MQNSEQIVSNYQQLLGAVSYELATARVLAQQLAQQLSEARAEIAQLKEQPRKARSKTVEQK